MTFPTLREFEDLAHGRTAGTVLILFGQQGPETNRVAKIAMESARPFWYVDSRDSDGAQITIAAGIRVAPVVRAYRAGFVIWEMNGCDIKEGEKFDLGSA